jgi:hypothetical protein
MQVVRRISVTHFLEYYPLSPISSVHRVSYLDDMGSLRLRTIKNLGLRNEPILEVRIKEYSEFLHAGA